VVLVGLRPLGFAELHLEVNTAGAHAPDVVEHLRLLVEEHVAHAGVKLEISLLLHSCLSSEVDYHKVLRRNVPVSTTEDSNLGFVFVSWSGA